MPPVTREAAPAARVAAHTELGLAVCTKIRQAATRLGVDLGDAPAWPPPRLECRIDPYSGEASLIGHWQDGSRYGSVTLFADQRVLAEYQLLVPHPQLAGQFVEAIQVWGTLEQLKSDPVLLPLPE
ncbi:hypothetical protein [Azovibrio restrictus]|uniref:hypothetical protein n=1 Tax=Azovibrio restrictus TaxID=146938 RepID=UPI0026F35895|nr:hypothetical protein [Azovibrio restrictus]